MYIHLRVHEHQTIPCTHYRYVSWSTHHRSHQHAHAMYPNWGYFAPALMPEHDESIYGKRKRHNISDACAACRRYVLRFSNPPPCWIYLYISYAHRAACRRSKVKCDEEKPCKRCVKHGRADSCISWRKVRIPDPSICIWCVPFDSFSLYRRNSVVHFQNTDQVSSSKPDSD